MGDDSNNWLVAVNACPYCAHAMPDRTEEDFRLAYHSQAGAWSETYRRITTGYCFFDHCLGCGKFLSGVEYSPEPLPFELQLGRPVTLVFDRWVAWHGLVRDNSAEQNVAPDGAA